MTPHLRPPVFSAARILPWLLNLATWMLARSLNMPEPLLHSTGALVFAHVQAVETRAAKKLCPVRLLRRLQRWLRPWAN